MPTRKDVFNKLNATKKLPTPSSTTMEVIRLCQSDATSLNDIAAVVQTDPALSAELLKYANAAFLATGLQVASIQKATVKLGMKTVVNVALGFSLLSSNKQGKCVSFDYEKFWSASLLQAIAAKSIASLGEAFDPEELFICGLLADMGQLALASLFPIEYGNILKMIAGKADCLPEESTQLRKSMEKHDFHIDSSELTIELFLDWGLPAHYALAAGLYDDLENNELGSGKTKKIAELLNTAQQISRICMESHPHPEQLKNIANAAKKFGVNETLCWSFFDSIISQWYDWGQIFAIKTRQCSSATIMGGNT
jgi:HD-like signal output (HDOD) protein